MSYEQSGQIPVPPPAPAAPSAPPMPPAPMAQQYQQQAYPQQPAAWPAQQGQPMMPGQYVPMAAPKPPSPMANLQAFSKLLPTLAIVAMLAGCAYGLVNLIVGIVQATNYGGASAVLSGFAGLFVGAVYAVVGFGLLMGIKYIIDMKQAKLDAAKAA